MKKILLFLWAYLGVAAQPQAQTCPLETNIANTFVCGLYGDANGNSNWDWELTDRNNPNFCKYWYARTGSNQFLTRMGSPFVEASSGKLLQIIDNEDYKKAKGWELLYRNFGCFADIANPYFVLYNRFTGIMRVYVYNNSPETYTQLAVSVTPDRTDGLPATTAQGREFMYAPDKYLANATGGTDLLLSVNESGGSSRWLVAESNMTLDPNIYDLAYRGAALKITIYGVVQNNITATLSGTSVTGDATKDFSFSPKSSPTTANSLTTFLASGEKLAKISGNIFDLHKSVKENATRVKNALKDSTSKKYWISPGKTLLM
jgi:hypothetical protein